MCNMTVLILLSSLIVCFSPSVSSDTISDAYRNAIEKGDKDAIYRSQSYLAPPYCYDLNVWHGIKFIKSINGRVVKPSYPFTYQDMTHLKVRKLYERAGIEKMIQESKTELELVRKLSDWANKQYGHTQPLPYPTWDANEILDKAEKGDAFWCTFKAALFVQACNTAGLTARMLGINLKDDLAHTVTEVYNNELRKWMLVDPWLNSYFERDGIPLSAREYHNAQNNYAGIYLVFGENGRGMEYWDKKTGRIDKLKYANARISIEKDDAKGYIGHYYDIRIVLRNDHTVHPQSKENIYVDGFMVPYNSRGGEWWGPQLHWTDDTTPLLVTCDNTNNIEDFEWPLNEVHVELKKLTVPQEPVVLEAKFSTLTPNFSHYDLEVDGVTTPVTGDNYIWKLKKGNNSLKVCTVNDVGRKGFSSEFVLEYDLSIIDFSRKVTVQLKNPGMEEIKQSSSGQNTPAFWQLRYPSNPLGAKEFLADAKVKHSGNYSLKVTPARDKQTGIDYAVIVGTEPFDVNPGTDVIYSIWLKASQGNTPVDIALLDAKGKGIGTYVERVMVGMSWGKYELKCRLHNELYWAYVGFKVYTGTVWADDAELKEIGTLKK